MNPFTRKLVNIFLNKTFGEFLAFVTGVWASGVVGLFFERRELGNLWGILARKTVLGPTAYGFLKWTVSILIGFFVLELVMKWIEDHKARLSPPTC